MYQHLRKMTKKETGASAVEYALLVVAIALIMVFGAFFLGKAIKNQFNKSGTCVNTVNSASNNC